jgi:hypothetical protein
VRDKQRPKGPTKKKAKVTVPPAKAIPAPEGEGRVQHPKREPESAEDAKLEAIEHVLETVEGLFREREGNLWGSMVKQTLKRKRPMFNESYHGYESFTQLLEDAQTRGLLKLQKEPKSGGYVILGFGPEA